MPKVLIADDDTELQELLKFAFESQGYETIIASDGNEAYEKIKSLTPDVVVLDILMPQLNGYEVCEKMRQNPLTCLIPVILLTSLTHPKDRITGIKLGADEYVCKPFEPFELIARVERLYNRTKQLLSSNPLSGLPTNLQFEQELKATLEEGKEFTVIYIDFDRLSIYNQKYGFNKGDEMIKLMGGILRGIAGQYEEVKLAAHLSEDDFALILTDKSKEEISMSVINSLEASVKSEDLSISIGIKTFNPKNIQHHSQVLPQVKELWKIAKQKEGNSYALG
jgi:diguanylate cyclase (GGDEF)-like protein